MEAVELRRGLHVGCSIAWAQWFALSELPKLKVAGSIPVARSKLSRTAATENLKPDKDMRQNATE